MVPSEQAVIQGSEQRAIACYARLGDRYMQLWQNIARLSGAPTSNPYDLIHFFALQQGLSLTPFTYQAFMASIVSVVEKSELKDETELMQVAQEAIIRMQAMAQHMYRETERNESIIDDKEQRKHAVLWLVGALILIGFFGGVYIKLSSQLQLCEQRMKESVNEVQNQVITMKKRVKEVGHQVASVQRLATRVSDSVTQCRSHMDDLTGLSQVRQQHWQEQHAADHEQLQALRQQLRDEQQKGKKVRTRLERLDNDQSEERKRVIELACDIGKGAVSVFKDWRKQKQEQESSSAEDEELFKRLEVLKAPTRCVTGSNQAGSKEVGEDE